MCGWKMCACVVVVGSRWMGKGQSVIVQGRGC